MERKESYESYSPVYLEPQLGIVPEDGSASNFYAKEAADWFGGFFDFLYGKWRRWYHFYCLFRLGKKFTCWYRLWEGLHICTAS